MEPVKIVLVGAGSQSFGPSSVRDVLLSEPLAERGVRLVLMDIVADHLKDIEPYARPVAKQLGRDADIAATTDLESALDGADFVITAIEVDRFLYWSQDFHIPRKHGFRQVFGENGGPGGIFHALRNMAPMIEIARTMERRCPSALLLNFTNPEHKLCEAVSRLTSITNVGLCHGVFMGIEQIAQLLEMPLEELDTAGHVAGVATVEVLEEVGDAVDALWFAAGTDADEDVDRNGLRCGHGRRDDAETVG